jgi:hypothetical protein
VIVEFRIVLKKRGLKVYYMCLYPMFYKKGGRKSILLHFSFYFLSIKDRDRDREREKRKEWFILSLL